MIDEKIVIALCVGFIAGAVAMQMAIPENRQPEPHYTEFRDPAGCLWYTDEDQLRPKLNAKGNLMCPGQVTEVPHLWEQK